jgi:hypothetical protein
MKFARALAAALLGFGVCAGAVRAQERAPSDIEVVQEWGAYYSSIGLHIPISDDPMPDGGMLGEFEVYRRLLERSYRPNLILLEASLYPMPLLGVYLRQHQPGFYDDAKYLVQAVTAGFQEPWAVSAFFGSQMRFTRAGESERGTNRGYLGYLISAGKKHIKDNVLIDDDWVELEWKLKGERVFNQDRLSWSFRGGGKFHRNTEIADSLYVGIRRSNLDFKSPFLSFLDNSHIEVLTAIPKDRVVLQRQELIFGKKYPIRSDMAWELDIGLIYERGDKYTGSLAPLGKSSTTLIFRPNLVF